MQQNLSNGRHGCQVASGHLTIVVCNQVLVLCRQCLSHMPLPLQPPAQLKLLLREVFYHALQPGEVSASVAPGPRR